MNSTPTPKHFIEILSELVEAGLITEPDGKKKVLVTDRGTQYLAGENQPTTPDAYPGGEDEMLALLAALWGVNGGRVRVE